MPLYVRVISYRGQPPAQPISATFDESGGTVGRAEDSPGNHLNLPDPSRYISRIHAKINCVGGIYTLTDTSVDGTYLNTKHNRVGQDAAVLSDGDQLWIGDYVLGVKIPSSGADDAFTENTDRFGQSPAQEGFFDHADQGSESSHQSPSAKGSNQDWWSVGNFWESDEPPAPSVGESDGSPVNEAFTPPDISDASEPEHEIPQDFNFSELFTELEDSQSGVGPSEHDKVADISGHSGDERPDPSTGGVFFENGSGSRDSEKASEFDAHSIPASPANQRTSGGEPVAGRADRELIRDFMDAAGLSDSSMIEHADPAEFMRTMGVVFRATINGLMVLLQGRKELKAHLLAEETSIKPSGNNPLKFFNELDDALRQLVTGDPPGFMDAPTAVNEGFRDIMNHHIAMNSGWQAALIDLVKRFDPQEITKDHENGVVFQRKAKTWDAYKESYQKIADDALENIFGKSFSDAYNKQIWKLRSKPEK